MSSADFGYCRLLIDDCRRPERAGQPINSQSEITNKAIRNRQSPIAN
jgi:hypothetical protein